MVSGVGGNQKGEKQRIQVTFGSDTCFHCLVWSNGFMSISMCQNLLNVSNY